MNKLISFLIAITFLTACAVKHQTASGRPEVAISSSDVQEIKGTLINEMVNFGYTLQADNGLVMIFEKPVGGIDAILYWTPPAYRAVFNFILARKPVRIVATLLYVKNPHSAYESTSDGTSTKASLELQDALDRTKSLCENQ